MKHYPKTPDEEESNARVGAVCLFLGLLAFLVLKSCGVYDKKYPKIQTTSFLDK